MGDSVDVDGTEMGEEPSRQSHKFSFSAHQAMWAGLAACMISVIGYPGYSCQEGKFISTGEDQDTPSFSLPVS